MIIFLIILAIYVVGFIVFARCTVFHWEQPSDKFFAGLFWPLILLYVLSKVSTGEATINRTRRR